LVLEAMQAVVHEIGGTAHSISELRDLGSSVAGKTGTAQYGLPDLEDYRCWFSGFAPANDPQIAFAVVIEHGQTGGKVAGPVAAKLLELCAQHGYIKTASSADLSLQSISGPQY
jgi:cell division protein FtsI/penicillin-binding protein 2